MNTTQESLQLHPESLSCQSIDKKIDSVVNVHEKETDCSNKHSLCLCCGRSWFLHEEWVEGPRHGGDNPRKRNDQQAHRQLLVVTARLLVILCHRLKQRLALDEVDNDERVKQEQDQHGKEGIQNKVDPGKHFTDYVLVCVRHSFHLAVTKSVKLCCPENVAVD